MSKFAQAEDRLTIPCNAYYIEEGCMTFTDQLRTAAVVVAFAFLAAVLIGMI